MTLTLSELELGWVEFHCDRHGFLVATSAQASVWCACGKQARRLRHGRIVNAQTLKPTDAKPRELNESGLPFLHRCNGCGADFGGKTALRRHSVGRGKRKRCLTPDEMLARGWRLTKRGRWSRPEPRTELSTSKRFSPPAIPEAGREPSRPEKQTQRANG